jgi:hypothetical protein
MHPYVVLTHDAIRYRVYGPGIEYQWGRGFLQPSRLALGLTQPPIQWVTGHSQGTNGQGIVLTPQSSAEVKERV